MNKSVIIAFLAGAAAGSVAAWLFTKTKYEQIMDAEIESAKEFYATKYGRGPAEDGEEPKDDVEDTEESKPVIGFARPFKTEKPDLFELAAAIKQEEQYQSPDAENKKPTFEKINSYVPGDEPEEEEEDAMDDSRDEYDLTDSQIPYVIEPEEFDGMGYETSTLTYYADGVLTDEWGDIVEEEYLDDTVGHDFASHFGENTDDPDSVYVRNDVIGVDYEICRDKRNYEDAIGALEE